MTPHNQHAAEVARENAGLVEENQRMDAALRETDRAYAELEEKFHALEHRIMAGRLACAKITTTVEGLEREFPKVAPLLQIVRALVNEIQAELDGQA